LSKPATLFAIRNPLNDLNPSTEFILNGAEGLRASSVKRLNGLNVLNVQFFGDIASPSIRPSTIRQQVWD